MWQLKLIICNLNIIVTLTFIWCQISLLGGECDAIIVRAPTNSIKVYPVKMKYFCIQDGLLDQTRKVCKIVPAQNSFSKKKNNIIRIITDIWLASEFLP